MSFTWKGSKKGVTQLPGNSHHLTVGDIEVVVGDLIQGDIEAPFAFVAFFQPESHLDGIVFVEFGEEPGARIDLLAYQWALIHCITPLTLPEIGHGQRDDAPAHDQYAGPSVTGSLKIAVHPAPYRVDISGGLQDAGKIVICLIARRMELVVQKSHDGQESRLEIVELTLGETASDEELGRHLLRVPIV